MKLSSLQIAGFRGFRDTLELTIPPGFLIVTGRNGSGKSSVIDSIEYALTGKLNKYGDRKEVQESVTNYLWWKGEGKPSSGRYVHLGFVDSDGVEKTIERNGGGSVNPKFPEYLKWFVRDSHYPTDAVEHLCRTRIIRDELITDLSVDLTERDRFEFVRDAVASFDFTDYEKILSDSLNLAADEMKRLNNEYEEVRRQISNAITHKSEIKGRMQAQGSLAQSENELRQILDVSEGGIEDLVKNARDQLKLRHAQLTRVDGRITELQALDQELERLDVVSSLNDSVAMLGEKQREQSELTKKLEADQKSLDRASGVQQAVYESFRLAESGLRVGLQDGCCPLCGSEVEADGFESHLKGVLASAEADNVKIGNLEGDIAVQKFRLKELMSEIDELKSDVGRMERVTNNYLDKKREGVELIQSVFGKPIALPSPEVSNRELVFSFGELTSNERANISEIEHLLVELETSKDLDKLSELEVFIDHQREIGSLLEERISTYRNIQSKIKSARAEVQRLAGEIVDERLAELSPLLQELYARIRPHADWKELAYHVRGDVRRFLSLRVGEDLNPTFMFSSGQRRAVGLAFLLAVNAASAWSSWNTLILDDPVQHIDDYRALHLVETLVALREAGYQIICSVEDPALAKLLARRLRSDRFGEGAILTLKYESGYGATQLKYENVAPLESETLKFA